MGGGCVRGDGAWTCLERWKWPATALTTFRLNGHECIPGSSGEGHSPHLFAPPHSPNTQPPPPLRHFHLPHRPSFSNSYLACIPWCFSVHATWFCHVNTQAPPPSLFACHVGHLRNATLTTTNPPLLLHGLSAVALKTPPCCTNKTDRSTTDGTSPCM
jgi:hypothetical protein